MLSFSSDFECGNGKNPRQTAPDRIRFEVEGDPGGYVGYYAFDLTNSGPASDITIEIHPDPDCDNVPGFISCHPCTTWVSVPGADRYRPLPAQTMTVHDDFVEIALRIGEGETLRVSNQWPAPYSVLCEKLRSLAADRADRCELFSIGTSAQGREILGLRAGTPGAPKVLCIAGQHPHEFSGMWAEYGIADYVSSLIPQAGRLRERLDVHVIPTVNPDGAVLGLVSDTAERLNMYVAFRNGPDAEEPEGTEAKLLWKWAVQMQPALWMNFHNYTGTRTNSEPPCDGWYEVSPELFADPKQRALYQALCDTLRLETDAPSSHIVAAQHGEGTFCYQLAKRYGIPHAFYETNGSTAGQFGSIRRGVHVFQRVIETLLYYL